MAPPGQCPEHGQSRVSHRRVQLALKMFQLESSISSQVTESWNQFYSARQLPTDCLAFNPSSLSLCISSLVSSLPIQSAVPVALAVAVAVGVAVPVANAIQAANNGPNSQNQQLNQQQISNVVSNALVALSITAPVSISAPFVVAGLSFRPDECGDGGIRFNDGNCYPVLRRGPCPDSQWILVDPENLTVTTKDGNFGTKFLEHKSRIVGHGVTWVTGYFLCRCDWPKMIIERKSD